LKRGLVFGFDITRSPGEGHGAQIIRPEEICSASYRPGLDEDIIHWRFIRESPRFPHIWRNLVSYTSVRHLLALTALVTGIAASSAALAAPTQGETLFKQRCATCHAIAPGVAKMGPPLKGIVGSKAGVVPGYAFSPALKASGLTWTTANLDKYLAKPTSVVPGTKMMVGLPDPAQRAAVIDYLSSQAK